jgi:hypothetical protein
MQQNNVIAFPTEYRGPEADLEKITENLDMMKHYHIQETIANIAPMIFTQLDIAGFSFDDEHDAESEQSLKEGAFIIEGIRALLCRHYGMYHPFQDLSDQAFTIEDPETPSLKIVDSLNVKFRKLEDNK